MSQVKEAIENLQSKWYNAFVQGAGMDANSFVFLQSGTQLPYTTKGLWQLIDAIPPKALTTVISFASINSFYQDYGALFGGAIKVPVSDNFKRVMGDNLSKWEDYRKSEAGANKYEALGSLIKLFDFWVDFKSDILPGTASAVKSAFRSDLRNLVNQSSDFYYSESDPSDPFNPDGKNKLYNIDITDIIGGAIAHGPSKQISLKSKTTSSDVRHTWAGGGVSGFWDIFSGGASGEYSKSTSKFTSSEVIVEATFKHVVSIPTFLPGNWYNSAFLNYALNTKDNTVWDPSNPISWESTFGSKGNMQRTIESLVVVDGIDIKVTSSASYSESEQTDVKAHASAGIWPFFRFNASGGYSSSTSFNDAGNMTTHTSCPAGNPAIFGANIRPIEKQLASYFMMAA